MQGFGIRSTTNKEEKYVDVYGTTECDLCAQRCFEIIQNGRKKADQIRITGFYDYPDRGYGVFGNRKELSGDYEVYNCGRLVCKVRMTGATYQDGNYVERIWVNKCEFHFYAETNDSAKLKAVLQGYFREKDSKETLRAEQEKQAMREAAQSKRNAEIASAQRFLDEMYKGM